MTTAATPATRAAPRDLVMGFCTNIRVERIEVFAKTLRRLYAPDRCDLVVHTGDVSDDLAALAADYAIELVYSGNNYGPGTGALAKLLFRALAHATRPLAAAGRRSRALALTFGHLYPTMVKLWHHPHFARWLCYREFLRAHPRHGRVLLSDVKDVSFQAPFFDAVKGPALLLFDQDQIYGRDNIDTRWYRDAYGAAELAKVDGKPSLCIGTVLGDRASVSTFVDRVCAEILRRPFGRIEQTILNKLYYSSAFADLPVTVTPNAEGPVLTLSCPYTETLFDLGPDGLLDRRGALHPIVHMYDRVPRTLNHFAGVVGHAIEPTRWT
jgi:hypothetical protein